MLQNATKCHSHAVSTIAHGGRVNLGTNRTTCEFRGTSTVARCPHSRHLKALLSANALIRSPRYPKLNGRRKFCQDNYRIFAVRVLDVSVAHRQATCANEHEAVSRKLTNSSVPVCLKQTF